MKVMLAHLLCMVKSLFTTCLGRQSPAFFLSLTEYDTEVNKDSNKLKMP